MFPSFQGGVACMAETTATGIECSTGLTGNPSPSDTKAESGIIVETTVSLNTLPRGVECNGDVTPVRLAVVIVCCKLGAATQSRGLLV
jgi:hypothetical protein